MIRDRSEFEVSHLKRIREVMGGKYRLADCFAVVAMMLDPVAADADLETFTTAKRQRDELLHGAVRDQHHFPTDAVISLARKYVALHLAATG